MYPEVSEKLARLKKPTRTPYSAGYVPTVKTFSMKRVNRRSLLNKLRKPSFNDLWGRGFVRTNVLDQSEKEFFHLPLERRKHNLALFRKDYKKKKLTKEKKYSTR